MASNPEIKEKDIEYATKYGFSTPMGSRMMTGQTVLHEELESKISGSVPVKTTPIYIYCRSGRRASTAVGKLKSLGYTDLHNVGGLEDAREKFNLPIK